MFTKIIVKFVYTIINILHCFIMLMKKPFSKLNFFFLFFIFCIFFSFYFSIHHRSGSTQTIFFCSSQMMVRRLVSKEVWSHQESEATLWYRHGSLSSRGSSLLEHTSSCSSDWPWRCSFDLEVLREKEKKKERKEWQHDFFDPVFACWFWWCWFQFLFIVLI